MKTMNLALAALLAVGTASAATISGGTESYGPAGTDFSGLTLSLAGYDHSAGTLIGIVLTLTGHLDTQYSASNASDSDGSLNSAQTTTSMTLLFSGTGVVTAIPVASLTGGSYTVLHNTGVDIYGSLATGDNFNSAQFNAPPDSTGIVNAFDTLSLVDFTVNSSTSTSFGTTGGNVLAGQATNGSGTAHVDFIVSKAEATPEPESFALIGGGLSALAYMLRRRKIA